MSTNSATESYFLLPEQGNPKKRLALTNEQTLGNLTDSTCAPVEKPVGNPAEKRCRQAIRHFCLECQGRLPKAVDSCEDEFCPLYLYRFQEHDLPEQAILPLRVVRQQCLVCCANERTEVRNCSARKDCSLWEFRFGVSPAVYRRVKARMRGPKHFTLPGLKADSK